MDFKILLLCSLMLTAMAVGYSRGLHQGFLAPPAAIPVTASDTVAPTRVVGEKRVATRRQLVSRPATRYRVDENDDSADAETFLEGGGSVMDLSKGADASGSDTLH